MPAPKQALEFVAVRFIQDSVPSGGFIAGLPADGSIITVPAATAAAWIAAGVAIEASAANEFDIKEIV